MTLLPCSAMQPLSQANEFTGMKWFEWPLLTYFAIHFFPPGPPALASLCLVLGVFGPLWEKRHHPRFGLTVINNPIIWAWCLLTALMYASLLQVPSELQTESWNQLSSLFLKGGFFGLALAIYLDSPTRARRLLLSGSAAVALVLLHCAFVTMREIYATGQLPFQRDYLFWLIFFFPFTLSVNILKLGGWRVLALFSAAGTLALAILTGFRGATLALLSMILMYSVFVRQWAVIWGGVGLAGIGVGILTLWFPTQASYLFAKFQQVSDSERFSGHWLPAWDMAMLKPWTGNGFGHNVFANQFAAQLSDHPQWTMHTGHLPRGQHSIVFETLFSSGWPGLLAFLLLSGLLIANVGNILWKERDGLIRNPWTLLALALLISYLGNFLIFYQFETPAWRTLPIAAAIASAIMFAYKSPTRKIL